MTLLEVCTHPEMKKQHSIRWGGEKFYFSSNEIITLINKLMLKSTTNERILEITEKIKQNNLVNVFHKTNDGYILNLKGMEIFFTQLSNQFDYFKNDNQIDTEERYHKCHAQSMILAQYLGYMNLKGNIVTGIIHSVSSKNKYLHSWIEVNINGEVFVLDYTLNVKMTKKGYYFLRRCEPINAIPFETVINDMKPDSLFKTALPNINGKEYLVFRDELLADLSKNFDDQGNSKHKH